MNSRKNQPNSKCRTTESGSRCSWRCFSKMAHRAGLKVSEFSVDRIVDTAIVKANCWKNRPVIPLMNTQGMNTLDSTRPMAMTGAETSAMA